MYSESARTGVGGTLTAGQLHAQTGFRPCQMYGCRVIRSESADTADVARTDLSRFPNNREQDLTFARRFQPNVPGSGAGFKEIGTGFSPRMNDKTLARAFKEHLCRIRRFPTLSSTLGDCLKRRPPPPWRGKGGGGGGGENKNAASPSIRPAPATTVATTAAPPFDTICRLPNCIFTRAPSGFRTTPAITSWCEWLFAVLIRGNRRSCERLHGKILVTVSGAGTEGEQVKTKRLPTRLPKQPPAGLFYPPATAASATLPADVSLRVPTGSPAPSSH